METLSTVLQSLQTERWAFSIDLKDAYLHVPVHVDHQKYLQFMSQEKIPIGSHWMGPNGIPLGPIEWDPRGIWDISHWVPLTNPIGSYWQIPLVTLKKSHWIPLNRIPLGPIDPIEKNPIGSHWIESHWVLLAPLTKIPLVPLTEITFGPIGPLNRIPLGWHKLLILLWWSKLNPSIVCSQ